VFITFNYKTRGFTFLELIVTVSIAAMLIALAAPALQQFIVRSEMQSLSNDFVNAFQRARLEAVNRNMCVTICPIRNIANNSPKCSAALAGDDWNANGWIIYLNPTCDTAITNSDPSSTSNIFLTRDPSSARFNLMAESGKDNFTFSPKGVLATSTATRINLMDSRDVNSTLNRTICVDRMGRTRIIAGSASCS
jgi:type IV fimbrial biogenesis protein FimT